MKEVYADDKQSYTVCTGDLPSSEETKGQWVNEFYNENQGISSGEGSSINNIAGNIEFVLAPLEYVGVNGDLYLKKLDQLPLRDPHVQRIQPFCLQEGMINCQPVRKMEQDIRNVCIVTMLSVPM